MKLIGTLSPAKATLQGTLSAKRNAGSKEYDGDYTACSKADGDHQLETADCWLRQNITVKQIPYYETSNFSDGLTVYIGSEVEFE